MKQYRIKKITDYNGKVYYTAQERFALFFWRNILDEEYLDAETAKTVIRAREEMKVEASYIPKVEYDYVDIPHVENP